MSEQKKTSRSERRRRAIARADRIWVLSAATAAIILAVLTTAQYAASGEVYIQQRGDGYTVHDSARGRETFVQHSAGGTRMISSDESSPLADEITPVLNLDNAGSDPMSMGNGWED